MGVAVRPLREELGSNMATDNNQPTPGGEPELNLLMSKSDLDQPLWKSLFQGLDELFFPQETTAAGADVQTDSGPGHLGILRLQEERRAGFDHSAPARGSRHHRWNHAGPAGGAADDKAC